MKKLTITLIILLSLTGCEYINNNYSLNNSTNINEIPSNVEEYSSSEEESTIVIENEYIHFNSRYYDWHKATLEDKYVLTVIGASFCSHCNNFKPIIEKVANDYNVDLYYYYIDMLDETEKDSIINSYETNYDGSVPHLFITKNGNVISNQTGEMEESTLIEFLQLNLVIQ